MHNQKLFKKSIAAVLLGVCLLLNISCWDSREIDNLALILAIGFDYLPEEDQVLYTSLTARPGQLGGIEEGSGQAFLGPVWIAETSGATLFEAARNLDSRSPRFVFESHVQAVVIGEEMALRGIGELVDYLIRERELRLLTPVLVTRGTAEEILKAEPELENNIAQEIKGIIESQRDLSTTPVINIKDFIVPLNKPGADTIAPVVEISEEFVTPDEELPVGVKPEEKKTIIIQGTAVFSGDKLAGYLNVPETKGMLWVRGEVSQAVMIPGQSGEGQVTVYITRSGSKLEPEFTEDGLKMRIQIETEGDIVVANIKKDIADPQVIEELERTLANQIKQEILLVIAKSKEYKSDFLHFGAAFRRKDSQKWSNIEKDWREILAEVDVEVRVIAEIRRSGLLSTPAIQE